MATRAFYKKSNPEMDNLATPRGLARMLVERFGLTLDVCATRGTSVVQSTGVGPPKPYFGLGDDGLSRTWAPRRCFMNPPYSQIGHWVAKAHQEADAGATVVGLLPAWTDRKWFHAHVLRRCEIVFIEGRLRFLDPATMLPMPWQARFPSMIAIWSPPVETP